MTDEKPKRRPGNPTGKNGIRKQTHIPTPKLRKMVEAMAGYGLPQDDIALVVEITAKTLRKHYPQELQRGIAVANTAVAQNLHRMATGRGREAATCAIFWAKTRLGWREPPHRTELTGKDGAPLIDLTKLSDAELDLYEKLVRKGAHAGSDPGGAGSTRH